MSCEHKNFGCRNGEFFCLACGAAIPNPYEAKEKAKEQEPEKKPARKRKGESK